MNPNHPPYNSTNLNLLDNMLMAAGFQGSPEVPKGPGPMIPPGYGPYHQEMGIHHHAMNLATSPHVQGVESIPILVYQQQQQQQLQQQQQQLQQQAAAAAVVSSAGMPPHQQQQHPISYKLPGGHHFEDPSMAAAGAHLNAAAPAQTQTQQTNPTHAHQIAKFHKNIQPQPANKKDIVAEALRSTEKIFQDDKSGSGGGSAMASSSTTTTHMARKEPSIKAEPCQTPPLPKSPQDIKPLLQQTTSKPPSSPATQTAAQTTSATTTRRVVTSSGLKTTSSSHSSRSAASMTPRLSLLEEEDDGLTCRLCLQSFWYKSSLIDHLKTIHSISDPVRYEREEREKKLKRMREEQQRIALIRRQRELRGRGGRGGSVGRGGSAGRGGGRLGSIRLTSPGSKPAPAGPRPSFQYRDGAFICDLCKKSFSDGNDMVTHWKSHVKKSQLGAAAGRGGTFKGGRSTGASRRGHSASNYVNSFSSEKKSRSSGAGGKSGKRKDKGRPRWTSYLVWSTRRRKELISDNPGWSFAEISRTISEEWKKVDQETKEKLQDEAEEMNATGVRKLPAEKPSSTDSDVTDTTEDSDFEESVAKKPIMLKIRKEGSEVETPRPRSGRQRKRPSFFQEFENEENNLDRILDDFELQQIQESNKPKEKKEKAPARSPGQRRRRKRETTPVNEPEEPVELETSRSGRIRKKIKFFDKIPDLDDPGELEELDEDGDEFKPDEDEPEDPEEDLIDDDSGSELNPRDESESDSKNLPPKKRAWKTKNKKDGSTVSPEKQSCIMTDAEIEEATEKARNARPVILLDRDDVKTLGDSEDFTEDENEAIDIKEEKVGENPSLPCGEGDENRSAATTTTFKKELDTESQSNAQSSESHRESNQNSNHPESLPSNSKEIHSNSEENSSNNISANDNIDASNSIHEETNHPPHPPPSQNPPSSLEDEPVPSPKMSSNIIDDVCLNTPMPCVPDEDDQHHPQESSSSLPSSLPGVMENEEEVDKELSQSNPLTAPLERSIEEHQQEGQEGKRTTSEENNSSSNSTDVVSSLIIPSTTSSVDGGKEVGSAVEPSPLLPTTEGGFGEKELVQNSQSAVEGHSDSSNNNPLFHQHESSTNGEDEERRSEGAPSALPPSASEEQPSTNTTTVDELLRPSSSVPEVDDEKYKDLISETQIENIDNIFN